MVFVHNDTFLDTYKNSIPLFFIKRMSLRFVFLGTLFVLLLASVVTADNSVDFELQGTKIAEGLAFFLDYRVEETLDVAGFDYSDAEIAEKYIYDFYVRHESKIWFNLGSDNSPIGQKKTVPLYDSIVFIDSEGKEVIKYDENGFSEDLRDVSIVENTEFKSEIYFENAKNMKEGEVFIGKVLTWYTDFDEVFDESSPEIKKDRIYEEVVGRDIMKSGIIRFSSPVYDNDVFKGVVVLSLDYRHLQELFKHFQPASDDPVISATYAKNYLLVFDSNGNTIFHPKPDNVLGYLDDGQLAGFNEPGSVRKGTIFNLYKYQGSFAYSEMAEQVLEGKKSFVSSATDLGGRTKVTLSVPVLYSNPKTNYRDIGVFAGIMMSIQLDSEETPLTINTEMYFIFGGAFALFLVVIIVFVLIKKEQDKPKPSFKKVVFDRIDKKFIFILGVILVEIVLIGFLVIYFQNQFIERQFSSAILDNEEDFADLKDGNVELLSATLEAVLNDEVMKDIYLEKDRDKLYEYGQPLFQELKTRYKITHFYFMDPDGVNFVRLHNKDIFGDEIKRGTFLEAKETRLASSNLELGKTAYALRVVMPYYNGDELIGYVELAQEVDEFFETMKKRKGNEFLMVVEKDSLNEEDWRHLRSVKGLRDNWDDLEDRVIVSSTTEKTFPCFSNDNIDLLRKKSSLLSISKLDDNVFACGGFSLIDISTQEPAVVFSLIDATEDRAIMFNMRIIIMFILAVVFFIFIAVGFYVSRKISKPIAELEVAAQELRKKNFRVRTNITTGDELQRLGETFNDTARVLDNMDKEHKQLEKAKTEFLSITSHELRSPMTPMQAQLQMLLGDYYGKLTDSQKKSIEIISRNTRRLDSIIVDFLEISRIEAARLKFRFMKDDPGKVVLGLLDEMKGFMPKKKIKIISSVGKLPVIEHDPGRLSQVLRNLINNAIKFSREGGSVNIAAKVQDEKILFSVSDSGVGMDPKSQKRIFEPFFQAEQTIYREHQGTGLGLAIVKGIVESQGGRVWLKSMVGEGTTFYFTLPLKPVKKVKPIKLLFSAQEDNNDKIKALFLEVLGPMGDQEFGILKDDDKLNEGSLLKYINVLMEKGIISLEKGQIFKRRVLSLFRVKFVGSGKINLQKIMKKGLIKTDVKKSSIESLNGKEDVEK